jgi:carnitine O-acetyltransferase
LFGFGPVVQDGFGIGYIIKDSGLQYSVSSKHRQTRRYVHTLRTTLLDLKELLNPISSMEVRGCHRQSLAAIKQQVAEANAYDDFFGEDADDVVTPMVPKPLEKNDSFSRYYRSVTRRGSISIEKLSQLGENLDLNAAHEQDTDE